MLAAVFKDRVKPLINGATDGTGASLAVFAITPMARRRATQSRRSPQTIFRARSTIGQTLPPFPVSLGPPDRFPNNLSGLRKKYSHGLGAIARAEVIFICRRADAS